jgi:ribosomal protein S18 acetylase RimI-like enzyme
MIEVRQAKPEDIRALYGFYDQIGKKDEGYFEHALEHATILLALEGGTLCAFCIFNQSPRYSLYKKLGIPEIQDLNVLPAFRRRGVATSLIKYCEDLARAQGYEMIGISVGLTKNYGPAQILYAKLGFVPDGYGVTYDRDPVEPYQSYPLDDDLALMMIKELHV